MSEESPIQMLKRIDSVDEEEENDEADLQQFQLRRTWESRYQIITVIQRSMSFSTGTCIICLESWYFQQRFLDNPIYVWKCLHFWPAFKNFFTAPIPTCSSTWTALPWHSLASTLSDRPVTLWMSRLGLCWKQGSCREIYRTRSRGTESPSMKTLTVYQGNT